jgi:L-amino acid N-acyltransferase YncA
LKCPRNLSFIVLFPRRIFQIAGGSSLKILFLPSGLEILDFGDDLKYMGGERTSGQKPERFLPGENMEYTIETMMLEDWEQVRAIYLEGIATGNATFEPGVPDWEKWDSAHVPKPRLVVRVNGQVAAWAALSRVSARKVYAGVAELSIYVGEKFRGKGIGDALLAAFVDASEKAGFWTLQGGIFPENAVSIGLHKKHGFRVLGIREKVGKMAFGELRGKWRDVVLMERRSKVAGID